MSYRHDIVYFHFLWINECKFIFCVWYQMTFPFIIFSYFNWAWKVCVCQREYHLSKGNNIVAQRSCAHYLGGMQSLKDGMPLKMWIHQGQTYQRNWFVWFNFKYTTDIWRLNLEWIDTPVIPTKSIQQLLMK
jgi:hypothetical protein